MTKLLGLFLLIMIASVFVFAETPTFFNQTTTTDGTTTNQPSPDVMTSDQFEQSVNALSQQTTENINQQIKDAHAAQRYPKPAPTGTLPNPTEQQQNTTVQSSTSTNAAQPSSTTTTTTTTGAAPSQPMQQGMTPSTQNAQPVPSKAPPPSGNFGIQQTTPGKNNQNLQQPQTYTGFTGATNPNTQGTQSNQKEDQKSSTWNIQY